MLAGQRRMDEHFQLWTEVWRGNFFLAHSLQPRGLMEKQVLKTRDKRRIRLRMRWMDSLNLNHSTGISDQRIQGARKRWGQRFCVLFLETCTPSFFSPSSLCGGIFRTKQALNLWHHLFLAPCIVLWRRWIYMIRHFLCLLPNNQYSLWISRERRDEASGRFTTELQESIYLWNERPLTGQIVGHFGNWSRRKTL